MSHSSPSNGSSTSPHVQGVNASAASLVMSTLAAAIVAAAILVLVWLPAEYGIDPTGAGRMLGLTQMGEIKEQLHAEADADAVASAKQAAVKSQAAQPAETTLSNAQLSEKLDSMQLQLSAIAASVGVNSDGANRQAAVAPSSTSESTKAEVSSRLTAGARATESQLDDSQAVAVSAASVEREAAEPPASLWKDELEYTLTPGEGIEIKLVMEAGAVADFQWTANGAVLNYDTHGDGGGQSISYEKGRGVAEQEGQLEAAFTGNHGWFWRNRTDNDVVVSVRTRGDYSGLVLP